MGFQADTLHLAIHLLNQSLCRIKVTTSNLQLLGMVCLFLAAKKEECRLPEVRWSSCSLRSHGRIPPIPCEPWLIVNSKPTLDVDAE